MNLGYAVLVLIVYALALMRLTRLINADTILDRPRLWIAGKGREHQQFAMREDGDVAKHHYLQMRRWNTLLYFVQCPWCVGMWLSFATVWLPLWFSDNAVVRYVGIALAASHLIGVCARFADTEEIDITDEDE